MRSLDSAIAEKIIPMHNTGITQLEVANKLGIGKATVSRYIRKAGIDRVHRGGLIARNAEIAPALPAPTANIESPLVITGRTLTMLGKFTGCNYIAGTNNENVDITLGDWMLCIQRDKLTGFIDELQHIQKIIGV